MKTITLMIAMMVAFAVSLTAKADYWMTFCKTPGGNQYAQVGYVKPDADGFVTVKAGPLTVVVYKTQVWYQKMPGEAPSLARRRGCFQSLARLYLRYNAPFTVEDVQELAPLKRSVAQRIIDEMCKAANEEGVGLGA